MIHHDDNFWMKMAIDIANEGKTPYGAVLVDLEGQQVSAFNTVKLDGPWAHAEMNVLKKMAQLDYDHPEDLTLYSTVEPCPMCMSAILWSKIGKVVFGASITDAKAFYNQIEISSKDVARAGWYGIMIQADVERDACYELLKNYAS